MNETTTKTEQKLLPAEYGLKETEAKTIESAFMPKIVERDGLKTIYANIIKEEITPEICLAASDIRKRLVKVRTGISEIHKTQKAYFLAAGRFVDAWKNKETLPVTQMEEVLKGIEEHFERIEAEKAKELQQSRVLELKKYQDDNAFIPDNLGTLTNEVWGNYLLGVKTAYEQRVEAERKAEAERIENERIDKLGRERQQELYNYVQFQDEIKPVIELGKMSDTNYISLTSKLKILKTEYEKEQERIRNENDRLKKEAEKTEEKRKATAEKERKEREKREAELKAEREKKEEIEKKFRAKIQEDLKAAAKLEADKQTELNKGDSEKVLDLISDFANLKTKYSFKSKKNKKMYADVGILLDKIINHINK